MSCVRLQDHYVIEFLSTSELIELIARQDVNRFKVYESKNKLVFMKGEVQFVFTSGACAGHSRWDEVCCSDHLLLQVIGKNSKNVRQEIPLWFMKMTTIELIAAITKLMNAMENELFSECNVQTLPNGNGAKRFGNRLSA